MNTRLELHADTYLPILLNVLIAVPVLYLIKQTTVQPYAKKKQDGVENINLL